MGFDSINLISSFDQIANIAKSKMSEYSPKCIQPATNPLSNSNYNINNSVTERNVSTPNINANDDIVVA